MNCTKSHNGILFAGEPLRKHVLIAEGKNEGKLYNLHMCIVALWLSRIRPKTIGSFDFVELCHRAMGRPLVVELRGEGGYCMGLPRLPPWPPEWEVGPDRFFTLWCFHHDGQETIVMLR